MAKKLYEESKIAAIAEKIRERAGTPQTFTTGQMPAGIDEVYDTGYAYGNQNGFHDGLAEGAEAGRREGYEEGFKDGQISGEEIGYPNGYSDGYVSGKTDGYAEGENAGRQAGLTEGYNNGFSAGENSGRDAMLDEMWDLIQAEGKRGRYSSMFAYGDWDSVTFKPKYDIKPSYADYMFAYLGYSIRSTKRLNVKDCLEQAGVVLDTSACTNMDRFAYSAINITRLPAISFESCTSLNSCFTGCERLVSIDKIILKADGKHTIPSDTYSQPFLGCTALTHMIVEGVIGCNYFKVNAAKKLDKESITSIINALSTTTSGLTVTISQAAKEAAFTADEWAALIATKPNWTISLV